MYALINFFKEINLIATELWWLQVSPVELPECACCGLIFPLGFCSVQQQSFLVTSFDDGHTHSVLLPAVFTCAPPHDGIDAT